MPSRTDFEECFLSQVSAYSTSLFGKVARPLQGLGEIDHSLGLAEAERPVGALARLVVEQRIRREFAAAPRLRPVADRRVQMSRNSLAPHRWNHVHALDEAD